MPMNAYLNETRLVEEVPGMEESCKYFLWHKRGVVWRGPSKTAGEKWAADNSISIDRFEPFEP